MKRSPLKRRKPLRRNVATLDERDAWEQLRQQVYARAGGLCDLCGTRLPQGFHAHHRRTRSRGGSDDVLNLVALHPSCHDAVHRNPRRSYLQGFLVPTWATPRDWPVKLHGLAYCEPSSGAWLVSAPTYEQILGVSDERVTFDRSGAREDDGSEDES